MKNPCLIAFFATLLLGRAAQADVVYTNAVNSSSFVTISSALGSRGQTFTNTGPTANIQSVTSYLKNTSSATGSLKIVLQTINSDGTLAGNAIGTSDSVTVGGKFSNLSPVTFTFSSKVGLEANQSYAFVINATSLTGSLDLYYGSPITGQNSILPKTNTVDPNNDLAGQVVTSAPEPGTLVLGAIAMTFVGLICLWKKWPGRLARSAVA